MNFNQIKTRLSDKKVGIAGCGGLGSNCAVALARVGLGKLVIADFDVIEESNLNRQYYFFNQIGEKKVYSLQNNIKLINPNILVDAYDLKLQPADILEIFENCDVIVEAFDRADMKEMLIETLSENWPDKPLITGLGMAGWGDNNTIRFQQLGNFYICGDGESEVSEEFPALAPRVGMVANMQANVVLQILLKEYK